MTLGKEFSKNEKFMQCKTFVGYGWEAKRMHIMRSK